MYVEIQYVGLKLNGGLGSKFLFFYHEIKLFVINLHNIELFLIKPSEIE